MSGGDKVRRSQEAIIDRIRRAMARHVPSRSARQHPFVTLTYAQSLDGSIARHGGEKLTLSNPHSQQLTHRVRALHDAILVGINTVLSDDPQLNVRLVEGANPQPVIVDSRLRFPLDARLLRDPCVRPIIATGEQTACTEKERRLAEQGARVVRMPLEPDGSICLDRLLSYLWHEGVRTVMVEGGAEILTSMLAAHLADQFLVTVAIRLVGGLRALQPLAQPGENPWPDLANIDYEWLAGDLIIRGDLVHQKARGRHSEAGRTAVP